MTFREGSNSNTEESMQEKNSRYMRAVARLDQLKDLNAKSPSDILAESIRRAEATIAQLEGEGVTPAETQAASTEYMDNLHMWLARYEGQMKVLSGDLKNKKKEDFRTKKAELETMLSSAANPAIKDRLETLLRRMNSLENL